MKPEVLLYCLIWFCVQYSALLYIYFYDLMYFLYWLHLICISDLWPYKHWMTESVMNGCWPSTTLPGTEAMSRTPRQSSLHFCRGLDSSLWVLTHSHILNNTKWLLVFDNSYFHNIFLVFIARVLHFYAAKSCNLHKLYPNSALQIKNFMKDSLNYLWEAWLSTMVGKLSHPLCTNHS